MDDLFDLHGKVAVITGSCGVLGGVMAHALAERGVKVVITGRKQEECDQVAKDVGHGAIGVAADVLKEEDLQQLCQKAVEAFGQINILVNSAGGNMPGATIPPDGSFFEDCKIEDVRRVMDLNFVGSVLPCLVIGKELAKQKGSAIINISSMTAEKATVTRVMGYSASKAAISNFTRWLSVELSKEKEGRHPIRVNALAPGFFIGNQNRALLQNEDGSLTARGTTIINGTPMRRFGEAVELIGPLVFLCSPKAASFVNGIVMEVDGGFSAFSGV